MKKSNINVLLVALTSAVALAACNSGSSPTPTPTPSPTPAPTPTPTPAPTPTPTPVPGESGVYALSGTVLSATYSTTPSTNTWVNYTSGTTNRIVGAVSGESSALLLDTNSLATGTAISTQTMTYGLYTTTGGQVVNSGRTLPVLVTVAAQTTAVTYLPAIASNQSASSGSGSIVVAPYTALSTGNGTVTGSIYKMYSITAAGIPTAFTSYNNISGINTPLVTVPSNTVVAFVNGMYYAYNAAGANTLLQSSDGINWQQITNNTVLNAGATNIATVVQVSGTVFAALDEDGGLYLGSSPANLTYISATSANGFIGSTGNGTLFVGTDKTGASNTVNTYTPTATALGAVIATNTASIGAIDTVNTGTTLVFAGDAIYFSGRSGFATKMVVNSNVITAPVHAVTDSQTIDTYLYADPANGGFLFALGSSLMQVNNNNTLADNSGGGNTNNGSISNITSVNSTTGFATFTNLPTGYSFTSSTNPVTGVLTLPVGFAGTTSGYMLALNNGAILVSSANGFVPAATVMSPITGQFSGGMPASLTKLFSANSSYLTTDATNLYYSSNNGTSWTAITPADVFGTGTAATLNINTSANGLYFITVTNSATASQNGTYQTATPQTLSSWIKINGIPAQAQPTYWNDTYYVLTNGSTDVGVYNPTTGQTVINPNVLPQNAVNVGGTYNVAYNGSSYALAQVNSNYLWTSADLIGGVAGWTQNIASFTGVNGAVLASETFLGPIVWTGKVWVVTGAAGNMYTAATPTNFAVGTYTTAQGIVTAVNGGTSFNLF